MAAGYLARLPTSTWQQLVRITRLVDQQAFGALCRDYGLRYVVLPLDTTTPAFEAATVLAIDARLNVGLVDLAPHGACA
jgi:hypothetical protein